MGVQDLLPWIKKTHPEAIQTFHKRWADPAIRGRKVAIDGTLMTMRFHLGGYKENDPEVRRKGGVIGWYNLISEMRASGVQPIAIWDQRGVRVWKAAEARKRLLARTQEFARLRHEEERADRLAQWKQAFEDFEQLSGVEQEMVRSHWQQNTLQVSLPKSKRKGTKSLKSEEKTTVPQLITTAKPSPSDLKDRLSSASDTVVDEAEAMTILDRTASYISHLSDLVEQYDLHNKPFQAGAKPSAESREVVKAIDHVVELEQAVTAPSPSESKEEISQSDRDLIDEALQVTVPIDHFTETERQTILTREEGRILNAFFTPAPPPAAITTATEEPSELDVLDIGTPTERLIYLQLRAPEVMATHTKSLQGPGSEVHADCKELLVKMGVPLLEAEIPYEAEGLAAALAKAGLVDFVATEDSDVLAYEGPLLKNVSSRGPLHLLDGSKVRSLTGLSPAAFLEFCILLGNDAAPRIPKIGPVTARKLIQAHKTIESVLEGNPKIRERVDVDEYLGMVNSARKVFGELPPIPDGLVLEQGVWDDEEVERLLSEKHGVALVGGDGDPSLEMELDLDSEEKLAREGRFGDM